MAETLLQVLQRINKASNEVLQLTDMVIGTVTNASPLEVSIDTSQAILKKEVLFLTAPVIEKEIEIAGSSEISITCYEQGVALPTNFAQRALSEGDKVLLMAVQHGQRFIILSRLYE